MSWRTVYIETASKISLNLDTIEIKQKDNIYNVALNEITTIIIEDQRTIITVRLLNKLCKFGINLIICSDNGTPIGNFNSYNNNSRTVKYNYYQLNTSKTKNKRLWQDIIKAKIRNQENVLFLLKKNWEKISKYSKEVKSGDITNREGTSARIYFKELFGKDFKRFDTEIINYSLNFGYQIVRSKIAQEIVNKGLSPTIGIFHKNESNYFNLADDFIEVYRPIIDYYIYNILEDYEKNYLTPKLKYQIANILNYDVSFQENKTSIKYSIQKYLNNLMFFYTNNTDFKFEYPKIINE